MKILEEKYPMGSFKLQKTPGRYTDEYLYNNLKILAKKIANDMTFLGIGFSSTLEVGTGKSVMFTQIGEIWTHLVNEIHGTKLTFTQDNIVWRPKALIERCFDVPKYSCILVDEWEDSHYWSELGMTLRQFFRKCRQLNLFILIIIPNFFQLPMNYALGRSVFAIDVKFEGDFNRGYFDFYNFEKKRDLYIRGKKTHNYRIVKPSFQGRFTDGYGIPEKDYRDAKLKDLEQIDGDEVKSAKPETIEFNSKVFAVKKIFDNREFLENEGITTKTLSYVFGTGLRTMQEWLVKAKKRNLDFEKSLLNAPTSAYTSKLKQVNLNDDKKGVNKE